jgi:hypothetical protein
MIMTLSLIIMYHPPFVLFLIVFIYQDFVFYPLVRNQTVVMETSFQMLLFLSSLSAHVSLPYCMAGCAIL